MKNLLYVVVLFFTACHQPNIKVIDPIQRFVLKRDSLRAIDRRKEDADSILQVKTLKITLQYALSRQEDRAYETEFYPYKDSSILVNLLYGNLFLKSGKHLIIKSATKWSSTINVFVLKNSKLKSLLHESFWTPTFVADTLEDVNGDHYKDLLINTYSSSGCCARSFYDVYIYNPTNDSFSTSYGFINPTFSPAEKVIRGVNYGHPGEVPLYKYKWNGTKIDTVEYIFPADTLKKKFYRVQHYDDRHNPNKRLPLNSVPKKYHNTIGYGWFIDY